MSHFPARRFLFLPIALAALACMIGCQGFSSANGSQSQNSQPSGLTAAPASVSFGSVETSTSQTLSDTLTNTSGSNLTITQVTASSAAFSATGLKLPLTLSAGQSAAFSVVFSPQSTGSASGSLTLTNSGSGGPLVIALSGTGVTTGATGAALSATPASLSFGGVEMGNSQSQPETVQNTGGSSATISGITATGTGFSVSGANTPITLSPGQTASFTVTFAPQSSGSFSGSVAVTSNAANPNLNIGLSGSAVGASTGQLSVSPSTIAVGDVVVGTSGSQTGTLSATGASIVVSSANVASSEFFISGLSFPVTIAAGQSANFTITFTPQSSGAASTSVSFVSNAANSPDTGKLTGTGVAAPVHSVSLSWNADNSPNVVGYNVYRRTGTSGSFSQINTALVSVTTYTDTSITDGETYYYETTAVNTDGEQSAPSAAVQAVIPPP
jgi:hypothetical protein